uniref:DUF7041 domain-containing protein n=1 Tax=Trichogramma kaykai TaxID=54128 RepID=A0ABD2W621_9HYME
MRSNTLFSRRIHFSLFFKFAHHLHSSIMHINSPDVQASNVVMQENQANNTGTTMTSASDASTRQSGKMSDLSLAGSQANSTAFFIELAQSFKALTDNMNSVISSFKEKLVGEVVAPSTPLLQFDVPPVMPQPRVLPAASIRPNLQINSIGVAEPSTSQAFPRSRISSVSCPPFSELPSDPFDLLERELYPTLDSPIVGPVALKPALKSFHFPSFWKHSPELWIDTIEENFRLLGVTNDHEKYIHTMSKLGGDVIAKIANAAGNLPRVGRFAALKKALLRKYAVHDKVQLNRFLEALDKAKHKLPSEFLDILAGTGSRFFDRSSILK